MRQNGVRVFPCWESNSQNSNVKAPRCTGGFKSASCDSAKVQSWWRSNPNSLVGLDLDKNILIVDIDVKQEVNGLENLRSALSGTDPLDLVRKCGGEIVQTPSGGYHCYLRHSDAAQRFINGTNINGISGVDIRIGEKGYVIAPLSSYPDQTAYRFEDGNDSPEKLEQFAKTLTDPSLLPTIPDSLEQALKKPSESYRHKKPDVSRDGEHKRHCDRH